MAKQVKSRDRVMDHGEVFTNEREVNAMLDMVASECERIESRFLEPACGDVNFLAEVLRRKLSVAKKNHGKSASDYERNAFLTVSSLYSVELLADNAAACRRRLFSFSSSRSRCCSGVLFSAALLDPVSLILAIQRLTVDRPKSYSDMISETGLPAL